MPKIEYVSKNFQAKSLIKIEYAASILEEYAADGWSLSLRQLYYQFVARDLIENTERSYKNLGTLVNNARLAGLLDWSHVEDRTRGRRLRQSWDDPKHALENAIERFHYDHWVDQECRVEVWVEKDALIDVVASACTPLDVPFMSCRGFMSLSEMWRASIRFQHNEMEQGKRTVIIYLGDHDPSGMDMSRDIESRIDIFNERAGCEWFDLDRIALTMHQIDLFNPPPKPAKRSDSRAVQYIKQHGSSSWELDALSPAYLKELIESSIMRYLDVGKFEVVRDEVEVGRERLKSLVGGLD